MICFYSVAQKESQGLGTIADWEASTDKKNLANQLDQMVTDKKAKREAQINARRGKLAAMLEAEELALQAELDANDESPEERRRKMATRARQLAVAREEERQILKAQLEEQHFRENCDPLRERLSKKILQQTCNRRSQQVPETKETVVDFSRAWSDSLLQLDCVLHAAIVFNVLSGRL